MTTLKANNQYLTLEPNPNSENRNPRETLTSDLCPLTSVLCLLSSGPNVFHVQTGRFPVKEGARHEFICQSDRGGNGSRARDRPGHCLEIRCGGRGDSLRFAHGGE